MPVIKPTVGRKLYYMPGTTDNRMAWTDRLKPQEAGPKQPLDATINYVNDNGTINALVVDNNGTQYMERHCLLVQEGDPAPGDGGYAFWMPFQVGQARQQQPERAADSGEPQTGTAAS